MTSDKPISRAGFPVAIMVAAEDAIGAISELNGRISVSIVRSAWLRRAAWTGYARALQLQGGEVDEIDVISWGAGVPLPSRPRRHTHDDEFGAFQAWSEDLHRRDREGWRDVLPFTPIVDRAMPRILQAIDLTRQYAQREGTIAPWLAMPRFLYWVGATHAPLPCLVAGAKAFRLRSTLSDDVLRATLKAMASAGERGVETLDMMEASHRAAMQAILAEYRPGKLPQLLALSLSVGLLSPVSVAEQLDLSIAGASKLLTRAAELGIVVEVSGRRSWKAFLQPDMAVALGLRKPALGRPRKSPPPLAPSTELATLFADFDREMAAIDARLSETGLSK